MKNKFHLFLILITFLSLSSSLVAYRTFKSFIQARTFTLHFNTRNFQDVTQEFIDELIVDIPNISATTIPIKAVKAMYLTNKENSSAEDLYNAKILLNKAINDNPFIKIPEAELSKIYFSEQQSDSAIYYGKIAFEGISKNPIHFAHYAAALASVGDTATIRNIYENL